VHPWIISLTSLCFIDKFADESVLECISSLTSLCFSELVPWRGSVAHRITSLTSLCFNELVPWRGYEV